MKTSHHDEVTTMLYQGRVVYVAAALLINPYDTESVADTLPRALEMSPEEKAHRMARLQAHIAAHNIYQWLVDILTALARIREENDGTALTAVAAPTPVLTGSHLDSQPTGGKFDGAYGVLAGFEVLEAMQHSGVTTRRPVELAYWSNEEGSRFQPGCMGSSVFTGTRQLQEFLTGTDKDGITVSEALQTTLAATPDVAWRAPGFEVAAYLEAHIEQGPILEAAGVPIGAVTGVQGSRRYTVAVRGEEAHAGTAPLKTRKEALKAAVSMIHALEEVMADETDTVRFTVGRLEVAPGSPNTVPGRAFFTIDFRHPAPDVINHLTGQIEPVCRAHARACEVIVTQITNVAPTRFDPVMINTVRQHTTQLGLQHMDILSGAGHDAMYMASVCPSGMIFIPCTKGVSHNETENTRPEDVAAGTWVLAECVSWTWSIASAL